MCKGKIKNILRSKWPDAVNYAEGGNSWVYEASDNGRPIAIKVFRRFNNPERYPRFLQEIRTINQLRETEGIVPVIEVNNNPPQTVRNCDEIDSISDLAYFVMPRYQGNLTSQLANYMDDDGSSAVKLVLQICHAVGRLHRQGLAHRDLKPENILFDADGNYFVSDFGLSIDLDNVPQPDQRLSGLLELLGSVSYRAPELLRGRLDSSDHRPCDVFAIGRILWSLIYGKEPHMITDLEFGDLTLDKCGRSLKKVNMLDDILRGTSVLNPMFRITIDELISDLENWLMDNETKTNEGIIDKLVNDSTVAELKANRKIVDEVTEAHAETKKFLIGQVTSLISEWSMIMQRYIGASGGRGNPVEVSHGTGIVCPFDRLGVKSEQSAAEGVPWVRVNFGTNKYHLIDFGVCFTVDPNRYDNQLYTVSACYEPAGTVPPDTNPQSLYFVENRFDYRQGNIREEILVHLSNAFAACDHLFRDQFKSE
jgi:serine/threonine protein kinase